VARTDAGGQATAGGRRARACARGGGEEVQGSGWGEGGGRGRTEGGDGGVDEDADGLQGAGQRAELHRREDRSQEDLRPPPRRKALWIICTPSPALWR
jgi:hypothetical protein